MSWKESGPVSERMKFITLLHSGQRSMTSLCHEFGISRKTGYKVAARFDSEGVDGLKDRSRAPHVHARETPRKIRDLLIDARRKHPSWGPRKLKAWLEDKDRTLDLPYPSTIGDLLKREGLVRPRRRRFRVPVAATLPSLIEEPNQEWDADFKGHFRLGNGEYTYPFTVSDNFSRYLLEVRALKETSTAATRPCLDRIFREFGLPRTLRTDNGSPFASVGLGRLSRLAVWCIKLGIRPVRGRPHHPQDNGRHERMHRTLKAETTRPPAFGSRGQQRPARGLGATASGSTLSTVAAAVSDQDRGCRVPGALRCSPRVRERQLHLERTGNLRDGEPGWRAHRVGRSR
jgi:transposase InsO family protein